MDLQELNDSIRSNHHCSLKKLSVHHRKFVVDDPLVELNYEFHINSESEELFFPYRIFTPEQLPQDQMAQEIITKVFDVPCVIDLDHHKEQGVANIIYSNWTGETKPYGI